MNDKFIGVIAIVLIIGGLATADAFATQPINPAILRLADIAVAGILGNMIGVHLRTKSQDTTEPKKK